MPAEWYAHEVYSGVFKNGRVLIEELHTRTEVNLSDLFLHSLQKQSNK